MSEIITDLAEFEKGERPTTVLLRKNILAVLFKHYPHISGWHDPDDPQRTTAWLIDIKDFKTGGMLTVRNLWLSGEMGFQLKLRSLDAELKKVVMAAGELQERFGVARDKGLDIREKVMGMPRDFKGRALHHKD